MTILSILNYHVLVMNLVCKLFNDDFRSNQGYLTIVYMLKFVLTGSPWISAVGQFWYSAGALDQW